MNKHEIKLPRCSECGGAVKLTAKPGRIREYRRGVVLPIPDDFETPICSRCAEEFMIPEVSEELDALLEREFLKRQAHELEVCTRVLRLRHGATQQDIEDACGVTRSYLSHLLAGRKEASETLMRLIKVFVIAPDTFEYAVEGIPFNKYLAGLFAVAPTRQFRTSNFGSRTKYRQDERFSNEPDPLKVSA